MSGQRILVIGATGMLGEPVAKRLMADGYQVRAMVRNPAQARERLGDGFELVSGDLEKPDTIARAMEGCFGAHLSVGCTPEAPQPERMEHQAPAKVAQAAAKAGLQRLTHVTGSMLNPDNLWNPLVRAKFAGENAVKGSGVDYTIFACTASMESLAMFVQGKKAMVPGRQNHLWHYFATEDFARMVSTSFDTPAAVDKHFYIHGPEAMTTIEALGYYCSELSPGTKTGRIPIPLMKLMGILTLNREIKFFAGLMSHIEKSPERGDPAEANRILGAPRITLAEWIDRQKRRPATE